MSTFMPVSKLLEVLPHVGKGAKFGVQKMNNAMAEISAAEPPVLVMGRIAKNMPSTVKVKLTHPFYSVVLSLNKLCTCTSIVMIMQFH